MVRIVNLGQLDLSCKNFVFLSVTTMTVQCMNFSCLNAHSNQISLCTEVSFNLKFALAKCSTMLTMHLIFNSCITWSVFPILNLNSWVNGLHFIIT